MNVRAFRPGRVSRLIVLIGLLVAVSLNSRGHATLVTTSGNFQAGSPTPTLSFPNDITFNITADGSAQVIFFDEWVSVVGSANVALNPSPSGQTLTYSLNGGPDATASIFFMRDRVGSNFGDAASIDAHTLRQRRGEVWRCFVTPEEIVDFLPI